MRLPVRGSGRCRLAGGVARHTLSMGRQTARLVGLAVSRTAPYGLPHGCIRTARINDAEWQSEPFRRIAHQVVKPAQPHALAASRAAMGAAWQEERHAILFQWGGKRRDWLDWPYRELHRTDFHTGAYGRRGSISLNGRIGFAFRSECGNGNTEARGRFLRHAESGILPADVVGKASAISYNVIYKGRPRMDFPSWRGWLRPAPLFSCAFFRQIAPEGKTVCISILPPGFGVDGCKPAFIIHNYGRRRAMSSEMINENWTRKDVETGRKNSIKTLHPKRGQGVPNEVQKGSKIGHKP